MVQLYSLMWILAVFFAVVGFLRGWNREVVATAGIFLGMFLLFQFDPILRGTLLLSFPRSQAFAIQIAIFLIVVYFAYQNRTFVRERRSELNFQEGLLGGLVGAVNGYLVGGAIWYFMDINEYPLSPYIVAPGPNSPSAEFISRMPLTILSGGVGGSGDLLAVAVIFLFLLVLIVL
jgi:hypothetical protein